MDEFWSLPGPSRFLDRLRSAVVEGSHVVIQLPRLHPEGLRAALADRLRLTWDFRPLEYRGNADPAAFLSDFLGLPDAGPARRLPASPECMGSVLWVEGIDESAWEDWRSLIGEFAAATKDLSPGKYGILVLPVAGLPLSAAPPGEVGLAKIRWQGNVDTLDMLLLAGHLLRDRGHSSPLQHLLAATISRLALWDPRLAERLAHAELEDALSPSRLLREYGHEVGWTDESETSWADGSLHMVDERPLVHSAHPEVTRDGRVLESRLWSAQASVLFALLEERKLALIPKVRKFVKLPFETDNKTIHHAEKLELTQIHRMVQRHHRAPQGLLRQLRSLVGVRNQLAHLDPISPRHLLDSEILRMA